MIDPRRLFPGKDVEHRRLRTDGPGKRVPLLVLSRKGTRGRRAAILWIHGGGYATGMKEMVYLTLGARLTEEYGVVCVSPGYRLSIQKPYPAAIDDCLEALMYMRTHADEMGIDPERIMVGGESAGGGLCAAVCMKARDAGIPVLAQFPIYPMIDDRDTPSSADNHSRVWNTCRNHLAWKLYLRGTDRRATPPYAAPARQTDYAGLPPCYTFVTSAEPFRDETIEFVNNLRKAGVDARIDVYHAMYHAFDLYEPKHPQTILAVRNFESNFERLSGSKKLQK